MRRYVGIDMDFALSVLGTVRGAYATWVNIPRHEIPLEIQIVQREERKINLRIIYSHERNARVVSPNENIRVFLCSSDGIVVGAQLRGDFFNQDLSSLLEWLRAEEDRVNIAQIRDNCRVVGAILRHAADQLFLPPQ